MIHTTLERIHREYRTTLVTVTHDINAALRRNSHVLALEAGRSVFAGTTSDFLDDASVLLERVYGIAFETIPGRGNGRAFFVPETEAIAR